MISSLRKISAAAIFDAQHNISVILKKHFEKSNRAKSQRQSYYYATGKWRDIKIVLMNKLAKVKSHLITPPLAAF